MERDVDFGSRNRSLGELLELRAEFFEQFPATYSIQLAQLRKTGRHGERIPRKRSRLIDRTVRRKFVHDFPSPAKRTDRQTAADHFSECGQVRSDSINFLGAAARHAKAG